MYIIISGVMTMNRLLKTVISFVCVRERETWCLCVCVHIIIFCLDKDLPFFLSFCHLIIINILTPTQVYIRKSIFYACYTLTLLTRSFIKRGYNSYNFFIQSYDKIEHFFFIQSSFFVYYIRIGSFNFIGDKNKKKNKSTTIISNAKERHISILRFFFVAIFRCTKRQISS